MAAMATLAQVHEMLPGSHLLNISAGEAEKLMLSRVGTDSRQIDSGELFIALSGERFDAHDFLVDVANSGAGAALISDAKKCPENLPAICVSDTRVSLGDLAKAWRASHAIPLALVTGSNGKTTVKEMIASIFKAAAGEAHTLVTKGNLNNDIGLPLTLLKLRSTDTLAVVELGMNHPGETAQLSSIAQANIALINNAQREHQEFMETVAAVAEEHADVIRTLPKNGIAVFPADSEFSGVWQAAAADRKVIHFALTTANSNSDLVVSGYQQSNSRLLINVGAHSIEVQLNTLGDHNVRNALAASAVAVAAGIPLEKIKQGLEAFSPVNGRMQIKLSDPKFTLIDDSYNANPDSVRAAIDALKRLGGKAWLVLGDMGEVGNQGPEFHREVGAYAAEQGISKVFALGDQCLFAIDGFKSIKADGNENANHFTNIENLISQLQDDLRAHLTGGSQHLNILVKGSRFMRMERVVQALLEEAKTCS
jgi:UDP-N-acetylmuramoyl-tripeptide--D-alanyl-D-alanine ligase